MADHPLVVEAKGWPQSPHLARRSYIHRRSVIQLLFGFVVLGFATALLYGFSMRGDVAWIVFAVAFVVLAVVVIGANVRTLGRIHLIPRTAACRSRSRTRSPSTATSWSSRRSSP